MTRDAFAQSIRENLQAQRATHPTLQTEDIVKFAFQSMLGVGHLLADRERVTAYIASEMSTQQADANEPLFEPLSPDWCRLNLRRAMAEGLPPDVIAGLMLASPAPCWTRADVASLCRGWADQGLIAALTAADIRSILDDGWLPSHSAVYRESEHPAYRVVSADWMQAMPAVLAILRGMAAEQPLVTIDGPCASGKTTLAERLATVFRAAVIHTDDYVIPHAQKTQERLAIPGGNCDAARLADEVVRPWKRRESVRYRRYSCMDDRLLPPEALPDAPLLLIEGSYSSLPPIREHADVRIFVDTPWETRRARLERRESSASLQAFYTRWIPLEDAYFKAYTLPDAGCVRIQPTPI